MRNFKKVIAGALALLMLALSVNVSFAAEEYTDKEAIVVAKVNAAGIMQGTDKGFEPTKTLTRAEAAAIMVRMKGISEDTVKQNAGTTLFTDVAASHWAAGYVNVASNYNIIKGVGANKFAPEKEVTVAEFYTMAIRALNAGQLVEAEGTWPTNYVNFAIENDLAEDVAQIYSAAATRMTAATIVANTLEAEMWKKQGYKSNGEVEFKPAETTIRLDVLKIYEVEDAKISVSDSKKNEGSFDKSITGIDNPTKFNEKTANLGTVKSGQKYTIWYNKDEVLGFWVKEDSKKVTFTNIKDLVKKGETKVTFVVDGKEKDYDILSNATIEYNGDAAAADGIAKPEDPALNIFGTLYLNNDGKVEAVYAEQFTDYAIVKEIKNDRIYLDSDVKECTTTRTISLELDEDDTTVYKVTKDGKGINVTDLEEGDAIFFYVDGKEAQGDTYDTYVIEVINDTVEGKVTATSGTNKITIDGKSYKVINSKETPNAGLLKTEGTFYLNAEGNIVMYTVDEESTEYAVIASIKFVNNGIVDENEYQIKLGYTDGTVSDWLQFHKDDAYHKAAGFLGVKDEKNAKGESTPDNHYDILGTLVKYEMKGGKVVLTAVEPTSVTKIVLNKNGEVQLNESNPAYLNNSSVVVELESNDEEKYDEIVKLNVLAAEDLDGTTLSSGDAAYIANKDHKDEVDVLVFAEDKSTIKTDKIWAFVLDEDDKYKETENEDLVYKCDVVYAGSSDKVTLYAKSDLGLKGKVVELTVEDNIIKSKKELTTTKYADTYLKDVEADYIKTAVVKDSTTAIAPTDHTSVIDTITENARLYLDDDLLVIGIDKDDSDKFKVSKLSEIDLMKDKKNDTLTKGTDFIKFAYVDKNADDEEVAVVIVYEMYK